MTTKNTQYMAEDQRQILDAFSRTLRREAHVLTKHPDLLWQQLYNRLQWKGEDVNQVLAPELTQRSAPGCKPWIRTRTSFRESKALVRTLAGHARRITACAISQMATL